jgi:hypothetical protein
MRHDLRVRDNRQRQSILNHLARARVHEHLHARRKGQSRSEMLEDIRCIDSQAALQFSSQSNSASNPSIAFLYRFLFIYLECIPRPLATATSTAPKECVHGRTNRPAPPRPPALRESRRHGQPRPRAPCAVGCGGPVKAHPQPR